MDDLNVELEEASFEDIETCASIALLGKKRTGKTTWCKHILQYLDRDIDRFVAMCGNRDNACEWATIINPLYVVPKNINFLERLRDYQDSKVSRFSEKKLDIPRKYRVCVILDDCGFDKKFMFSPIIRDILSNGRHYGITIIILAQYLNQMHSENRDQLDYLGMLHTSNLRNIKKVHDEYCNVCDKRTFSCVLAACTGDKGMCWIDNTKTPERIEECVFYKKQSKPFNFARIGSSSVRRYGTEHYLEMRDIAEREAATTKRRLKKEQAGSQEDTDAESTDEEDDDEREQGESIGQRLNLEDIPPGVFNSKNTYRDKRGTITIEKSNKQRNCDGKIKKD